MSQAKKLLAAYTGALSAHGTTTVGRIGRNGKAESQSKIVREPMTEKLCRTSTALDRQSQSMKTICKFSHDVDSMTQP